MSWRTVVVRENAKLDLSLGHMVIRQAKTTRINLNEVATVIIESTAVSITASLINELVKQKIKVVFSDEKRNPCCELIPHHGSYDSSLKIKMQIAWTDTAKEQVWTDIVREKIRNQMLHLKELDNPRAELLEKYLGEILPGDSSNREGHAAKVYFNALFGLDFTRNTPSDINSALNYGYSLLSSAFSREICNAGYLTQLGVFHDNLYNHFNLSSDFMEPFRPIIDREVVKMKPQKFDKEEKTQLLKLLNLEVTIDGRRQYLMNAIKIYCKSVIAVLNGEEGASIKFYTL